MANLFRLVTVEDAYFDLEEIKKFLENHPSFDINKDVDGYSDYGYTPLYEAVCRGRVDFVSFLLKHPKINVNALNDSCTPLMVAIAHLELEVVKTLLLDSRVDVNSQNKRKCTPMWVASCRGALNEMKWMIALRGDNLDAETRGIRQYDKSEVKESSSPLEIAKFHGHTEVISLLENFISNPVATKHELCLELGLSDASTTSMFALMVFICDALLTIRPSSSSHSAARFLSIASRLPMELQMILCHRLHGSTKDTILSKDSEAAFKHTARVFSK